MLDDYVNTNNMDNTGICDDINGNDHHYEMKSVSDLQEPRGRFILDLDLDFFAIINNSPRLFPESKIRKYLDVIMAQGQRTECVGITVALEPDCCGSISNSLKICRLLSKAFEKDILPVAQRLIENASYR